MSGGPVGDTHIAVAPGAHCPVCGHGADCATNVHLPGAPEAGDISLCIYCAAVLTFFVQDGHLALRSASREDLADLTPEAGLALSRTRLAIEALRARRAREVTP